MISPAEYPDVYNKPVAYGVDFPWGDFYLTQAAIQEYGLISLTTDLIGDVSTFAERPPCTKGDDVGLCFLLATPSEMSMPGLRGDTHTQLIDQVGSVLVGAFATGATKTEVEIDLMTSSDTIPTEIDDINEFKSMRNRTVVGCIGEAAMSIMSEALPHMYRDQHNGQVLHHLQKLDSKQDILHALEREMTDAMGREIEWRNQAIALGEVVSKDICDAFIPNRFYREEPPF